LWSRKSGKYFKEIHFSMRAESLNINARQNKWLNDVVYRTPARVTLRASRYARQEVRHGQVPVTADA
jgi:hypothetical protein